MSARNRAIQEHKNGTSSWLPILVRRGGGACLTGGRVGAPNEKAEKEAAEKAEKAAEVECRHADTEEEAAEKAEKAAEVECRHADTEEEAAEKAEKLSLIHI